MKKTMLISVSLVFAIALILSIPYGRDNLKKRVTIHSLGNDNILEGNKLQTGSLRQENLSPEARQRLDEHRRDIQAIDQAWDHIGNGNASFKAGDYEKAAVAYEKAYSVGKTQRHVSGFHLAETYEKLGRYDDAIAILDNMIKNRETNEYGIKKANEMKMRLNAAKDINR